ncbi:serine/threonine-protein kinase MPS1-like isoform X2 [Macadamia integrifolia]|uniref:serine/threonine-protein kinase MPS1-like isoform X2 n=1 Tax=Macadamia integrifolia TaxID=60698 RepID=UPI001C4E6B31|nr:serine/threonine-protein kinase MPS1-like isoform X2 [Macadamia integrifolia]
MYKPLSSVTGLLGSVCGFPGTVQSESLRPRRVLVSQRESEKGSEKSEDAVLSRQANATHDLIAGRENAIAVAGEVPDDSSITPPSNSATGAQTHDQNLEPFGVKGENTKLDLDGRNDDGVSSSCLESQHLPAVDVPNKGQISLGSNVDPHKMEWIGSNRVEISTANDHNLKQRESQQPEVLGISLRSDGGISSLLAKRSALYQDQRHQSMTFIGKDIAHPMTQSSLVVSTCATTTSVHSLSAPMLTSKTYTSCLQDSSSRMDKEPLEELKGNPQPTAQGDAVKPCSTFQYNSEMVIDQKDIPNQSSAFAFDAALRVNDHGILKVQQDCNVKECEQPHNAQVDHGKGSQFDDKPKEGKEFPVNGPDVTCQAPSSRNTYSDVKLEPSKSGKPEKASTGKGASVRKKNNNADLFFRVNGKLYQKLGKIGSGGSSEVYKVISADCTIYALKKIRLKGRDYATACGFCQEIGYLNKLKGKNNVIQLIDYEVTDKILLEEVMSGSMNTKDGRIKDDGYIYMVLEYGEIDLAHMLSQKWKEIDSSNWSIDENWLRFYWQVLSTPFLNSRFLGVAVHYIVREIVTMNSALLFFFFGGGGSGCIQDLSYEDLLGMLPRYPWTDCFVP